MSLTGSLLRYEKDKTEDDSNRKYVKCYGDCLQHSLATARQEACDLMDQYNRDFDEWKHDTIVAATSVSYGKLTSDLICSKYA